MPFQPVPLSERRESIAGLEMNEAVHNGDSEYHSLSNASNIGSLKIKFGSRKKVLRLAFQIFGVLVSFAVVCVWVNIAMSGKAVLNDYFSDLNNELDAPIGTDSYEVCLCPDVPLSDLYFLSFY